MSMNPALQKLVRGAALRHSRIDDGVDHATDYAAIEDQKVVDRAMAREGRKLLHRANRLELEAEALPTPAICSWDGRTVRISSANPSSNATGGSDHARRTTVNGNGCDSNRSIITMPNNHARAADNLVDAR
ncbi:hypothetical protein [Mesorhizobium sp. B1-1-7]|uniref:hypothetical protein n=1 Tax=Mesorhizobium sp. B1-1-7 TaxID=2589977 RepID=UPI001126FED5|nr:hypothetical protein [Mesorhizobium sp. B1-1-7]TPN53897.1 hypothetical protein FJ978_07260 [Mesorhizobium sp. B1-1-7]